MARMCPLFSGSSGNCTYVSADGEGLLIDAGVSARRIETALRERDIDPASIRTVAVTHEHSDHIAGIRVLCKKYGYRILASEGTLRGLESAGVLADGAQAEVLPAEGTAVGGLWLRSFPTPHDTPESNGFSITLPDGRRITIATDIGHMTDVVREALCGSVAVLIESNHDVDTLRRGPYPYALKQRILGERGHLSNDACDAVLPQLVESGVTYVVLAHLSRENNRPELAMDGATRALAAAGVRVGVDCRLQLAAPTDVTPTLWL